MKNFEGYHPSIQVQIKKAGGIEAWRAHLSSIGKLSKPTTHGFNNPEVRERAINNSLKSRGYKRKTVHNSNNIVDKKA